MIRLLTVMLFAMLLVSCDKESSSAPAMSHEGQGEEVTADPAFVVTLKIGASEASWSGAHLAIFESKPATADKPERPQGFSLAADNGFTIAGALPADAPFAPSQRFQKLIGLQFAVAQRGGDPGAPALSKVQAKDGKVYLAKSGTVKFNRAFYKKGQYAGVSGTIEVSLQEIKLGNPDDPNNKGDQPIGAPINCAGTFTSQATAYPYEQL